MIHSSTMRMPRSLVAFGLAVLSVFLVSYGANAGGSQEANAAARSLEPTEELVIYTYDSFPETLEVMILDHFESEYGVAPSLERFQDTGGLFNELWLERENPRVDVVIGLDNTYVGRALEA
ncbi:MAG TPA: hypothetical protein VKA06_10295, partial [Spirochaetia bacterium]|nr:hypothetical protein [Spirochaetia bacterium]